MKKVLKATAKGYTMILVSNYEDGVTSITPFENDEKVKAEKRLKEINAAGGTAILLEVGK